MNKIIIFILVLIYQFALPVHSKDDKTKKKNFEEIKEELREKLKDALLESIVESAEKLEDYYRFKTALALREIALERFEERIKLIDGSLKKIEEIISKNKEFPEEEVPDKEQDADTETKKKEKINEELSNFAKIAEKLLQSEKIIESINFKRCKYWVDEDKKGKENSLIYVKTERKFVLSRERSIKKYYVEIKKYDEKEKFHKADQKRILLKNALSRQIIFFDGKIKAYESTLKSIKKRKKLKDTTVQKKAELRIKYYKWAKIYSATLTETLKKRVDAELKKIFYRDIIFYYENFNKYCDDISYPEYLKLNQTETNRIITISKKRIMYLDKDKKNPE